MHGTMHYGTLAKALMQRMNHEEDVDRVFLHYACGTHY